MLKKAQWLTVSELSELWHHELKIPKSTIEREIRIALYKLEKEYPFAENVKVVPKDEELPSKDTLISKEFVERFCDKEEWKLPAFWYDAVRSGPSFPGRSSIMSAIVQELEQIAERKELADTLAEQSRFPTPCWSGDAFISPTPTGAAGAGVEAIPAHNMPNPPM